MEEEPTKKMIVMVEGDMVLQVVTLKEKVTIIAVLVVIKVEEKEEE